MGREYQQAGLLICLTDVYAASPTHDINTILKTAVLCHNEIDPGKNASYA